MNLQYIFPLFLTNDIVVKTFSILEKYRSHLDEHLHVVICHPSSNIMDVNGYFSLE